jgi:hypothetical protein
VELTGKRGNLAVVELKSNAVEWVRLGTKYLELSDPNQQPAARSFFEAFNAFCRVNEIGAVAIKGRAAKGPFAGGAVGHKMEGILQLLTVPVSIVSHLTLAAFLKKNPGEPPEGLLAYQLEAFNVARFMGSQK